MHSHATPLNQHGETVKWPRLYDQHLPSQFHLWPFIAPWDFTHYPVLYDHQRPWRSYCIQIPDDPWYNDVDWYARMDGANPRIFDAAPEIQRVLMSCIKVFDIMVRLLEWASLSLKMPNNSDFPLLKDWGDFRKKKSVWETPHIVKHFVMHAADL